MVFFFASAGVSAAYLTVSEIFPLETRALCIALFYAVGTGLGGIIGPQLFAPMIATGKASEVFKALAIGAILMIIGGVTEIVFGVDAERKGSKASPSRSPPCSRPHGAARSPGRGGRSGCSLPPRTAHFRRPVAPALNRTRGPRSERRSLAFSPRSERRSLAFTLTSRPSPTSTSVYAGAIASHRAARTPRQGSGLRRAVRAQTT